MNELKVFSNSKFGSVRTLVKDGEIWFVAKDVCAILGITNSRDSLSRVSSSMKGVATTDTLGGKQELSIVSEAGLYKLVFTSRKPEAEKFTDWVASEVIPSIRKYGMYATEELINNPDLAIQAFTALKEERERRRQLEFKIEEDKPKVLFAEAVNNSDSTILVRELAKLLKQNGVDTGEKRLFEYLRNKGYLISKKGNDYNLPTQKSMDLGLFIIKESVVSFANSEGVITKTVRVTGKGQQYFINKFKKEIEK